MTRKQYPPELKPYLRHPDRLLDITNSTEWDAIARAVLREADATTGSDRVARLTELDTFCVEAALRHQLNEHIDGNGQFIDISIYLGLIAEASEEEVANWPYVQDYRRGIELNLERDSATNRK